MGAAWGWRGGTPNSATPQRLTVNALRVNGYDNVNVGGSFTTLDKGAVTNLANWSGNVYAYNIGGNSWASWPRPPFLPADGAAMASDGVNYLYALAGGGTADFYRYSTAVGWEQLADLPVNANPGTSLVLASGKLYAAVGKSNKLFVYDPLLRYWRTAADAPHIFGLGSGLGWDDGAWIYATNGGNGQKFFRYNLIKNIWEDITSDTPAQILSGGDLTYANRALWATAGGDTPTFWTYGPVGIYPEKLTISTTAVVAPAFAATPLWTTLDPADPPEDFFISDTLTNRWVSDANWSPQISVPRLGVSETQFLNSSAGVYRVGATSVLTAGYSAYVPPAYVYPDQASCEQDLCQQQGQAQGLVWGTTAFDTIQAAIDTGARTVYIMPGRYPQDFYLVSGLSIFGAGADKTLIEPPGGTPQTLVTAEGTAANQLALLTLLDDNNEWHGFSVEGGSTDFRVTRLILRGLNTAVEIRNDTTTVDISNLTLVGNTNGLRAVTCAPLDLRNTIFSAHSGTALSFEQNGCPTEAKHQYNLYWANASDFNIDGTAVQEPGLGELFANPIFVSPAQFDYRLAEQSPAIDRGNPGDPVPPGTNGRIDMGYVEDGQASFYADDDYCATCLNDGLVWGVTAFSKIQDALNAADQTIRTLYTTAPPSERFTVGVGAGTYREQLDVPSYVQLYGTNAADVIVDGGNQGHTAVVDGGTQIEIRGLTFSNASEAGLAIRNGAQRIIVYRVISRDNKDGVSVSGAATADLYHLTLVDNNGAGLTSSGQSSRASIVNSILANNDVGLQSDGTAVLNSDFGLLNNTTNAQNVTLGANDVSGQDPQFNDPASDDFTLKLTSPAVDSGSPVFPTLIGGGQASDRGYQELLSIPIPLFLGQEGISAAVGNSGVKSVEVGVVSVTDPSQPVTATLPTSWQAATLGTLGQTGSYWTLSYTPQGEGLYRIYSRASDRLDNAETNASDWYEGQFAVDTAAPTVNLVSPVGTTNSTEAAIKVRAEASDYLTSGGTTFFSVAQVYFAANGTTYPATWVDNGWTPGSGQPRQFEAWIPLPTNGATTVTAVAEDYAGQESSQDLTINVSTPANVATITTPEGTQATNKNPLTVQGFARFTSNVGGMVTVQIDSDPAVTATQAVPDSRFSFWSVSVPVNGQGSHTINTTAVSNRGANAMADDASTAVSNIPFSLDETPPTVTLATPASNSYVAGTVNVSGTADDDVALDNVALSIDGGFIWREATLTGTDWSLDWTPDITLDEAANYLLQIRAVDTAGNRTIVSRTVTADLQPPTGLDPVTFSLPEGSHVDTPQDLTINWQPAIDNSGVATVTIGVDQVMSSTVGADVLGTSYTTNLSSAGEWYVHLGVRDPVGNERWANYGPWHVGSFADSGTACGLREQTIQVDGVLDLLNGEWELATERLDADVRPTETQALYTTWDAEALYLGWEGAYWEFDGTLWFYLDLASGGTTNGVTPLPQALPLEADTAVQITSGTSGTIWQFTSGAWQMSSDTLEFAQGGGGETEIRLPWAIPQSSGIGLFALARNDDAETWSTFPTTNVLDGAWSSAYTWNDLCNIRDLTDGQPQANDLTLELSSPQDGLGTIGPNGTLDYVVRLRNNDAVTVTNATVTLEATTGLAYQSIGSNNGATCTSCPANGQNWLVTVPEIVAGELVSFTVGAALNAPSGTAVVTTTAEATTSNFGTVAYPHRIDALSPVLTVDPPTEAILGVGAVQVVGQAQDQGGGYVAEVEYRLDGGAWRTATGTNSWRIDTTTSNGQTELVVDVRASDQHGNTSAAERIRYAVDGIAPELTLVLPEAITNTIAIFGGTAVDPFPDFSRVTAAEVRLDDGDWESAFVYDPDELGDPQQWSYTWNLPAEDNVQHTVRVRGYDVVLNLSTPVVQSVIVDNVAPTYTVGTVITQVVISDYQVELGDPVPPAVLAGQVTDGSGVRDIQVLVTTPDGRAYYDPVFRTGNSWEYVPALDNTAVGNYQLTVFFTDEYGNVRAYDAPTMLATDEPITGLAVDEAPFIYATAGVPYTATVSSGTNISYTWDFGDGNDPINPPVDALGEGMRLTYAYQQMGTYTLTLSASNNANAVTVTKQISVTEMPIGIPLVETSFEDNPFTAGWTTYNLTPVSQGWQLVDDPVHTGETAFFHDDGFGTQDSWLVTPRFTPSSRSELIFWQYQRYPDNYEKHSLWVSTGRQDPKDGDYVALVADLGAGEEQAWQVITQTLTAYAGQEIYVAFRYEGDFADEWGIDDVTVTSGGVWFESNSPIEVQQTTMVTGFVGSGSGVTYNWDFGNGDTAVGQVISYTYPTYGVYTITMTAENSVSQVAVTGTYTVTPIMQYIPLVIAGNDDVTLPFDEDVETSIGDEEAAEKSARALGKAKPRPTAPTDPADLPIFNLTITSTAPTRIGQSTTITAVVQTGTNMTFTMDVGDGSPTQVITASSPGFPPEIEHIYPDVGVYTVTVTAVNEVSVVTATTPITITDYPIGEALVEYGFETGEDLSELGFHQMTPLGPGWQTITSTVAYAGDRVLFHDDDFGLQDSWVVFPATPIVDGSMLRFWQYTNYRPEYEKHSLWYSVGSPDPKDKDFVEIMEILPAPEDTWEQVEIDLIALAGQDVYLALRYEGDFADEWLLDEIELRTDLRAENDGPTNLGQVTTLHAGAGLATNVEFTWDLGDGNTAVGQNVTHTYPALGIYTATVTATNGTSQATAVTTVTVKPAPQYLPLVFTSGTPITPTAPITPTNSSADPLAPQVDQLITVITLTNSVPLFVGEPVAVTATLKTGTNISYTWDFGAGGELITSTLDVYGEGDTAVYTYTQRGTYTVTLVAENSVSAVTSTLPLTITDVPLNTPIISDIFGSATLPSDWQTFKLTPLGAGWVVTDTQVRSEPYALFHNDDATDQDSWLVTPPLTPMKGSELVFWQYQNYAPEIGKHSVWVSMGSADPKDGDYVELADLLAGEEDVWSQVALDLSAYAGETVHVGLRYEGDFADEWTIDDVMVTADVQVENDSPTTWGEATVFTATAGLATNVRYSWDFGDGNMASSRDAVISHTYAMPGIYTATVTARNDSGSETVTTTAVVEARQYLPAVFYTVLPADAPAPSVLTVARATAIRFVVRPYYTNWTFVMTSR